MQLSFLDDHSEMMMEIDSIKKAQENLRRGLFQRLGEVKKELDILQKEMAEIKCIIFQDEESLLDLQGFLTKL